MRQIVPILCLFIAIFTENLHCSPFLIEKVALLIGTEIYSKLILPHFYNIFYKKSTRYMQIILVESEKSVFVNFDPGPFLTRFRPGADLNLFSSYFSKFQMNPPLLPKKV